MINDNIFTLPNNIFFNYRNASPFPHIVIDNFLDAWPLTEVNKELDTYSHWRSDSVSAAHQPNKFFAPDILFDANDVELFSTYAPKTKMLLDYLYSAEMLQFLENLTGIPNLLPDYSYTGGGVHNVYSGGKLDIHADFGTHLITGLFRRINLLIYITPDWNNDWGGELQLWDKDMTNCCIKIPPIFNRAVIFNTSGDSFHGHPEPLTTPAEISRRSIALYYFTTEPPGDGNFGNIVNWQTIDS